MAESRDWLRADRESRGPGRYSEGGPKGDQKRSFVSFTMAASAKTGSACAAARFSRERGGVLEKPELERQLGRR